MKCPRWLRWLLIVACALPVAFAADNEQGRPLVQVYTPRDYDGDNQVWCAVPAPDGTMFFGSQKEVLIFDGARWTHVAVPARNVRGLAWAPDGRMYVGGTDAIGYLARDPEGNWIYHNLLDALPEARRATGSARGVFVRDDAVYFLSAKCLFRWRGGTFRAAPCR